MGYVPLLPPPTSAAMALARYEKTWTREMRGRFSRFPWRRRKAYAACLALIRARDAVLGYTEDPWVPVAPPKPNDPLLEALTRAVGKPSTR